MRLSARLGHSARIDEVRSSRSRCPTAGRRIAIVVRRRLGVLARLPGIKGRALLEANHILCQLAIHACAHTRVCVLHMRTHTYTYHISSYPLPARDTPLCTHALLYVIHMRTHTYTDNIQSCLLPACDTPPCRHAYILSIHIITRRSASRSTKQHTTYMHTYTCRYPYRYKHLHTCVYQAAWQGRDAWPQGPRNCTCPDL